MPTYSYSCTNCNHEFELFFYISDYDPNPECGKCKSLKTHRMYVKDVSTQSTSVKKSDSELKTIGDLAQRNRDKLSDDEKHHLHHKHNSYKNNKEEKPLPKGMEYTKKPKHKIKWIK